MDFSSTGQMIINVEAIETASTIYDWTPGSDEQAFLIPGDVQIYDGSEVSAPTEPQATARTTINADA